MIIFTSSVNAETHETECIGGVPHFPRTWFIYVIKYWNTSVRNKFFGARFIVHFTLHVSAPIGGHLQVIYKHIKILIVNNNTFCFATIDKVFY
jgi:hypothetical protein